MSIEVGRIEFEPVYRVRLTTDPSVRAVTQPINASAEAVAQLQLIVAELLERIVALEAQRTLP